MMHFIVLNGKSNDINTSMKKNTTRRQFISTSTAFITTAISPALFPVNMADDSMGMPAGGLTFLFQGDSITDGNRGRTADPNHIMGHGYTFAVASRVGADFPSANHQFYNRGISGNRVPDLQQRWQTDTLDLQPDVVSILIGINDTAAAVEKTQDAQTVDEFETGYRDLLTRSRSVKPNLLLVLGLPFVTAVGKRKENFDEWKRETAQRAIRVQKLAGEFDALLVDYPAVFDKAESKAPADYWIWDGIHPTVAGHELMAREWIKVAAKKLDFLKAYHY